MFYLSTRPNTDDMSDRKSYTSFIITAISLDKLLDSQG